jgi:translation initiation factor 2-alpha kinase 4
LEMRKKWEGEEEGAGREACLYNFRTANCVYYDVGL